MLLSPQAGLLVNQVLVATDNRKMSLLHTGRWPILGGFHRCLSLFAIIQLNRPGNIPNYMEIKPEWCWMGVEYIFGPQSFISH